MLSNRLKKWDTIWQLRKASKRNFTKPIFRNRDLDENLLKNYVEEGFLMCFVQLTRALNTVFATANHKVIWYSASAVSNGTITVV